MKLIERAANAAREALLAQGVRAAPESGDITGQVDVAAVVHAVLQAIREPDEEMSEAGAEIIRNVGRDEAAEAYQGDAVNTWRYMIDAALGE
jgi:hypothetical protein